MKTITLEQLEAIIIADGWTHSSTFEVLGSNYIGSGYYDEIGNVIEVDQSYGVGCVTSKLGDLEIICNESFWFVLGADDFDVETYFYDGVFKINYIVEDLQNNKVSDSELWGIVRSSDNNEKFIDADYSDLNTTAAAA